MWLYRWGSFILSHHPAKFTVRRSYGSGNLYGVYIRLLFLWRLYFTSRMAPSKWKPNTQVLWQKVVIYHPLSHNSEMWKLLVILVIISNSNFNSNSNAALYKWPFFIHLTLQAVCKKAYWMFFWSIHCEKSRNFTWFSGVEILWKGTVSTETVPFDKISTPEN